MVPNEPSASADASPPQQRRLLKNAKHEAKRNRKARPPRRKDWTDLADADWDEVADVVAGSEPIMPRDERQRRKLVADLMRVGDGAATLDPAPIAAGQRGQVFEVSTGLCRVNIDGQPVLCSLRGSLTAQLTGYTSVVAVGDWVVVSSHSAGQGVIEQVLPRASELSRRDPFLAHLRQVVAANVDQLLIVASWRDPDLWPELIDRYIIAAVRNQVTPLLCVNKIDLAAQLDRIEESVAPYRALGYRVLLTSAQRGDGIAELRGALSNRLSVLAGLSGVGKSSLLRALRPDLDLCVAPVNEQRHQGRHTTTQASLLALDDGSYVIDTPGIREFGLAGLTAGEIIAYYPELAEAASRCQFSDCRHDSEPGCAVRAAVQSGAASAVRYDSYLKIRSSLSLR